MRKHWKCVSRTFRILFNCWINNDRQSVKLCAFAARPFQSQQSGALTRMWRWCQVQPPQKERAMGAVHCKHQGMLLQLLRGCCNESVVFVCPIHENDQRWTCRPSCDISKYWWIWTLSFLLQQFWIGIDYFLLNFFATFGSVLGLQITVTFGSVLGLQVNTAHFFVCKRSGVVHQELKRFCKNDSDLSHWL